MAQTTAQRIDNVAEALHEFLKVVDADLRSPERQGTHDVDVVVCHACLKTSVRFMFDWAAATPGEKDALEIFQIMTEAIQSMINVEAERRGRVDRVNMSMRVFEAEATKNGRKH